MLQLLCFSAVQHDARIRQSGMLQSVAVFMACWSGLYVVDHLLQLYWPTYREYMTRHSCSVHFLQLRWYTQRFNRLIHRTAQCEMFPWSLWFNVGVMAGLLCVVCGVCLLTSMVYNTLVAKISMKEQVLTPVLPGVNLPMSHLGFYFITFLVCAVYHEVGHALAAAREGVRLHGIGFFLLTLYPGAYVDLNTSDLNSLTPWRKLKISCAGVWHNIVLVLAALVLLACFFATGRGVTVHWVREDSVVHRSLRLGESITALNDCPVHSSSDWRECIEELRLPHTRGFCTSLVQWRALDMAGKCCAKNASSQVVSNTHLCFAAQISASEKEQRACLPVRILSQYPTCRRNSDCRPLGTHLCAVPQIENDTRLVPIYRSRTPKTPLLFLGDPRDIFYSISVGDLVARSLLQPHPALSSMLQTFCYYLMSFSAAIAVFNVVPCYLFDGQWILACVMDMLPLPRYRRQIFLTSILIAGTLLVAVNVFFAVMFLFMEWTSS